MTERTRLRGGFPFDLPSDVPDDAPVFVISVAATLAGMHPQTLRQYDRLGLVSPGRSSGRGRRYSTRDIALLREVQRLSQDEGINLAGIKRILELESHVDALRARLIELQAELDAMRHEIARREQLVHASYRRDLVPLERGAMVVWRPQPANATTPTTPTASTAPAPPTAPAAPAPPTPPSPHPPE